ncbi:DNA alkylation repair protein [Pseudoroseicyclus sp. CXY001]|uniref:DNA alkylation repair protein n=1 Tax=Pseudoroseicyclus sp. CXY001 TaxID=3242492 RepID=UPI0035710AF0
MTRDELMAELKALGDDKMRESHIRHGAGEDAFGVKMGDIRKLAKASKGGHELALELWETGQFEARMLAILLMKPKRLSAEEMEGLIRENRVMQVSDWLNSYVLKQHPAKEELRQRWESAEDPMLARAYWSLTAERVTKAPEGLALGPLLDRIEAEMAEAPPEPQWTMNNTLAAIGINHEAERERALEIGERLGVYRDYPTPKGCTSPFAPLWINEMVGRQS